MKKNSIFYEVKGWILVILIIMIVFTSCNKKVVPQRGGIKEKIESGHQKSIQQENFNYLFIEGLKQKIFGNYKNALKYFYECEKVKEDDAVEYQLSGLYALEGKEVKSVYYGEKSITHAPDNIWYYYQLANVYQIFGKKDSVIYVYKVINAKFPLLIKEKVTLGDLYNNNGEPDKALKIFRDVEKKYGKSIELNKKIINALISAGRYNKALEDIANYVQLFGSDKEILLMKAFALEKSGKSQEENILISKIEKIYPDDIEVEQALYKRDIRAREYDKAIEDLKSLVYNKQIDNKLKVDYLFQIIDGKEIIKKKNDTILSKMVQKVFLDGRNDLRTNLMMVDYYSRNKQYIKEKNILNGIIKKFPLFKVGWQQMLYTVDNLNENDSVIFYASEAIKLFADDPLYDLYLTTAYLKLNKNYEVIKFAKQGIQKIKKKGINYVEKENGFKYKGFIVQLYGYLGEAYKNIKEFKKSDEAFEEGLKINPNDDYILNNYSYYLSLRKEKLEKARKMSEKTIKQNPGNSTYLDTYGWILYNMGNLNEAEKYIKKALRYGGNESPEILEHYGNILYKKGNVEGAVKYWKNSIAKGGKKEELKKKIEKVLRETKK